MINSGQEDQQEVLNFAARFQEFGAGRSLIAARTNFGQIPETELQSAGFNIIIYDNHMLSAAYPAMVEVAKTILVNGCYFDVTPIDEITKIIPGNNYKHN